MAAEIVNGVTGGGEGLKERKKKKREKEKTHADIKILLLRVNRSREMSRLSLRAALGLIPDRFSVPDSGDICGTRWKPVVKQRETPG